MAYSQYNPKYNIPSACKLVDDYTLGGGLAGRYFRAMNTLPDNVAHENVVANTVMENQRLTREMDDVWHTTIKSRADCRNIEHANNFTTNFWPSYYPVQQPWTGMDLQVDQRNSAYNCSQSRSLLEARARGFSCGMS